MNLALKVKTKFNLSLLVAIFLVVLAIILHLRLYQYAFDDAYIHFRVARNLFETGTPYYNPGEMIKVSTSSGWIVYLTSLYAVARLIRIDHSFPLIVGLMNAIISLCAMVVYTKIIEAILKKELSAILRASFQFPFLMLLLPSSIGLMETPLAILAAGLGIYLLIKAKPSGFALLGAAVYIRLELLLLLILTGIFIIVRKQLGAQKIIGYTAIGIVPLIIFDLYFYHTVIPHSIVAKSMLYQLDWFIPFLVVLTYSLPSGPLYDTFIGLVYVGTVFLTVLLMTATTAIKVWIESNIFWPLLFTLWSVLIAAGYIIRHVYIFEWYMPLYTIPMLLAVFSGLVSLNHFRIKVVTSLISAIFLLSFVAMVGIVYAGFEDPSSFSLFEPDSRVKTYLAIGDALYKEYPDATLLTSEIGGLGYSFRGKILDAGGLASIGALDYHPMKIPEQRSAGDVGAIPPGYVKATMPDLIVSYDTFIQALLKDEVILKYNVVLVPALQPEDEIYSRDKAMWENRFLRVYVRKDLTIPESIVSMGK